MNSIIILGNISQDIDLKETQTGKKVARFSVAVRRDFKVEGQPDTDFFNVVAWSPRAEFIAGHFSKGDKICIGGQLQNRPWETKEGQKRISTEIIVDKIDFAGGKREETKSATNNQLDTTDVGFIEDLDDESDLPF